MEIIMDIIIKLYKIVGSLVCHQLPSRTLHINGIPLPLCARDTGIYIGFFISMTYIYIKKRHKADSPPSIKITILFCFFMLFMIIDGATSYLRIRTTNNTIRYFSGILFGLPLPFLLIPAAYFNPRIKNIKKSIYSIKEVILILAINIIVWYLIFKMHIVPWFLLATITIGSLIYLIWRIIFTIIIHTSGNFKKQYVNLLSIGYTTCTLIIMFCISYYILQPLKTLLLNSVK